MLCSKACLIDSDMLVHWSYYRVLEHCFCSFLAMFYIDFILYYYYSSFKLKSYELLQ